MRLAVSAHRARSGDLLRDLDRHPHDYDRQDRNRLRWMLAFQAALILAIAAKLFGIV